MEWSWTVEEFMQIILSPRERTYLHQTYTWADQLIVVEVEEVADVEILTVIEDMIVSTTDMKTMITDREDHLLLTIVNTDHDQDIIPTAQDAIDKQSGCS